MYNPWSAHNHGHAHHPHAHAHHGQHTHHGNAAAPSVTSVSSVPGTASRMDLDPSGVGGGTGGGGAPSHTQASSQSSYTMSQMRWLPSMVTTRSHNQHHNHNHNAASLPTISSGLRLQHPQQQGAHSHAQASVIDVSRAPPPPLVNPGSVNVGVGVGPVVESVESEESDRSESPGETTSGTRDVSGADALGEPEFSSGRNGLVGVGRGDDDGDVELLGESTGGTTGKDAQSGLTPRKHGKRLTTKEEVSLFEICNRHAADFGRRSNLCKWWMTVTLEFTRGQKHPYSWHSVRRKVEIVTKQRMKFLEEQRDKGTTEADDLSNPRWRAVVDAWIPTWQRWEEAEAARIEKRDSRRPRKRKWTVSTPTATITTDGAWDLTNSTANASNTEAWQAPSSSSNSPMVTHTQTHPAPPTTSAAATPVRLPPGFDTMFSQTQAQQAPSSIPYNQHTQRAAPAAPATDNTMMAAVLETLGKLNKHLDSSNNNNTASTQLQPTDQQALSQSQTDGSNTLDGDSGILGADEIPTATLTRLKEDLRREMMVDLRAEWDKERAVLEEKLDSVQRTQEMILEMLRQEPS
ncbi:hypothetical protein BJX62DRAFT_196922 [Aspergillus germanicus]